MDADAHCMIGNILAHLNRTKEATAEYQETLKINPQHPEAQQGLKNIESESIRPGNTINFAG